MVISSLLLVACLAQDAPPAAPAPANAQLAGIRNVYILSMPGGFDQHLANQLRPLGYFQIVTDPLRADTIITDRLGDNFELKLAGWDAEEARAAAPPEEKKKEEEEAAEGEESIAAAFSKTGRMTATSFSRGKGTLFFVERKSRRVLWSTYEKPTSSNAEDLNASAKRIAAGLRKEYTGEKK
jgi:hypothetical protein